MGEELRELLLAVQKSHPNVIKEVRGRGLLNAIEMNLSGLGSMSAYDVCLKLKERGILAKPTHDTIIRLSPPLTIRSSFSLYCIFLLRHSLFSNTIFVDITDQSIFELQRRH